MEVVDLGAGDARVAVVADTHARPHPRLREHLAALRPTAILHGGDIGDIAVIESLEAIAPVYAVRGNIDEGLPLPEERVLDLRWGSAELRVLLTHIAVYGPKLRAEVAKRAREVEASLVVCGHSHVPLVAVDRGITVFNPGSCGPRRFDLPIVFGLLQLGEAVRPSHVACETGEPWRPQKR